MASENDTVEVKRLKAMIENIVYYASHTLRAPISTSLGLLHLMEVDSKDNLANYASLVKNQMMSLDRILADISILYYNLSFANRHIEIVLRNELDAIIASTGISVEKINPIVTIGGEIKVCCDVARFQSVLRSLIYYICYGVEKYMCNNNVLVSYSCGDSNHFVSFTTYFNPSNLDLGQWEDTSSNTVKELDILIITQLLEKMNGGFSIKKEGDTTMFIVCMPIEPKEMM